MSLSVIIPTYNRVDFLLEAIGSVVRQGIDDCEIIVCDDGSTEDIESVKKHDVHSCPIVISRSEERLGAQVARNRGLDLARGEFVLFLDSDDVLAPGGLNDLYQVLRNDDALDYAYGKVVRCNEKLEPRVDDTAVGDVFSDVPVEVAGYHWHTMGALYRKSYLEKVGHWNVDLTGSQDWEYQARVKLEGGHYKFIDVVVGHWRQHGGERVGTEGFRPDYVKSVMVGCESILSIARKKGRCDSSLERRLAKRLIVHALEWGANGYVQDRRKCLMQAKACLSSGQLMKLTLGMVSYTPSSLDRFILKVITKR